MRKIAVAWPVGKLCDMVRVDGVILLEYWVVVGTPSAKALVK
jgi:hypothetical protein